VPADGAIQERQASRRSIAEAARDISSQGE
jgi:hypothetical protein